MTNLRMTKVVMELTQAFLMTLQAGLRPQLVFVKLVPRSLQLGIWHSKQSTSILVCRQTLLDTLLSFVSFSDHRELHLIKSWSFHVSQQHSNLWISGCSFQKMYGPKTKIELYWNTFLFFPKHPLSLSICLSLCLWTLSSPSPLCLWQTPG